MTLPKLDASRCIACGDCVALCPTQCLAMGGPLPWLPRSLDCVACEVCVIVCPTAAIAMSANLEAGMPLNRVEVLTATS